MWSTEQFDFETLAVQDLYFVFNHNLYFTANTNTMYSSYSTMLEYTGFRDFLIPLRWRIRQILLYYLCTVFAGKARPVR